MKPNFALDFRNDQITLLHRNDSGAARGWTPIGSVAVNDPDLDAAMGYLRSTALGMAPRGIATKLILPNEAVLYATLNNLSGHTDVRRAQITTALIGRTPYAVDDLAFDWTDDGTDAHLAVIARETLAEAEAFAVQHRLNPVGFGAWPDAGPFEGEAWFGQSDLAGSLLVGADVVERDTGAVVILDAACSQIALDQADAVAAQPVLPDAITAADFQMGADMMPPPEVAPVLDETPVLDEIQDDVSPADLPQAAAPPEHSEPEQTEAAFDMADLAKLDGAKADAADDDTVAVQIADKADLFAQADLPDAELPDAELPEINLPDADLPDADLPNTDLPNTDLTPQDPLEFANDAATTDDLDLAPMIALSDEDLPAQGAQTPDADFEAPMALDVLPDDLAPDLPDDMDADPARDLPSQDAPETAAAAPETGSQTGAPSPSVGKAEALLAAFAARREAALGKSADLPQNAPRIEPVVTLAKAPLLAVPTQTAPFIEIAPSNAVPPPKSPKIQTSASPGLAGAKSPNAAVKNRLAQNSAAKTGAKTGSGARASSPWLGFILTAALLIALAAAAAMSSYITAAWNTLAAPQTEFASTDTGAEPTADDEALADGETLDTSPEVNAIAAPEMPAEMPAPVATNTGTVTLASRDSAPPPTVATSLPLPEANAASAQITPQTPAPPDQTAAATAPLITPTAQGVLTPEGVFLIAGRPKLVPAPRTDVVLAAYAARKNLAALDPAAGLRADPALAGKLPTPRPTNLQPLGAPTLSAADPALAGKLPKPRPAGLAPAPLAAPEPDALLAGKRPADRPANILAAGRSARLSSAAASLTAQAETAKQAAAAVDAAGPRSPLAVAISRLPAPRPRGLKAAAEAAQLASLPAPQQLPDVAPAPDTAPEVTPAPDTNAAPEADNEPETPAPSSGTGARTTVSKQATFRNAINLSKVNLIGVYGSKSNRYALIRQANGRYKKLKVGDRFDGGQIAAITDSEMLYSKGGQMIALKMPKG